MRKSTALLDGTQTSSASPSGSNYIQMTILGDTSKDNISTRRKPFSVGSLFTINLARTAPESNPGLRGERLSTWIITGPYPFRRYGVISDYWVFLSREPLHLANSNNEELVVSNLHFRRKSRPFGAIAWCVTCEKDVDSLLSFFIRSSFDYVYVYLEVRPRRDAVYCM